MPINDNTSGVVNYYFSNSVFSNSTMSDAFIRNPSAAVSYGGEYDQTPSLVETGVRNVKSSSGIHPLLYFKYIKKKFQFLEQVKMNRRVKSLKEAFEKAVDNGQELLAERVMNELLRESREMVLYAKGYTKYIEREHLMKHKRSINDGHISDTPMKSYTRHIPEDVIEKKKKAETFFDGFVIFHYWNEKAKDVKKMPPEEKSKMRDPILFGIIKETDRLYFVADWEDEYCDLTFDKLVEVLGKSNIGKLTARTEFKL